MDRGCWKGCVFNAGRPGRWDEMLPLKHITDTCNLPEFQTSLKGQGCLRIIFLAKTTVGVNMYHSCKLTLATVHANVYNSTYTCTNSHPWHMHAHIHMQASIHRLHTDTNECDTNINDYDITTTDSPRTHLRQLTTETFHTMYHRTHLQLQTSEHIRWLRPEHTLHITDRYPNTSQMAYHRKHLMTDVQTHTRWLTIGHA